MFAVAGSPAAQARKSADTLRVYWCDSFGGGMDDLAKDAELTRMLVEASPVAGPARKAAYGVALKRETEQGYWVPLSTAVTVYGISRQLNFKAYQDEMPRCFQASWK